MSAALAELAAPAPLAPPGCAYCGGSHNPAHCCCEPFTHENRCPACVEALAEMPAACVCQPGHYDIRCGDVAHATYAAQDAASARMRGRRRRY